MAALARIEKILGRRFGDSDNPLLVSVRSGARESMPGMMDTVLNLGLNDRTVQGLIRRTQNPRFAYDSYRRFVQMYADVVLGLKPKERNEGDPFEEILELRKKKRGVRFDTELEAKDLEAIVAAFKELVRSRTGKEFPSDPEEQLWGADRGRFWFMEQRSRRCVPRTLPYPGDLGDSCQRSGNGIRKSWRKVRHGRGFHKESFDWRKIILR